MKCFGGALFKSCKSYRHYPHIKEKVKMVNNRLVWEAALKKYFEDFLRKLEMADVPEVLILTFLKAEVEKLEDHVESWIDLSKHL